MPKVVAPPVDRRIAAAARAQHGAVTLAQLRAFGLSSRGVSARAARGQLHRIHRGVYAVGHSRLTRRGARLAAVLAAGPGAVLSHRDAAALWSLSPFGSGLIHVTVPTPGGRALRNNFVIHRSQLHPDDRAAVDGIPVTSVARTLLDLAGVVQPHTLRRLYAEAERLELLDRTSLIPVLERSQGRRGVAQLRALLAEDVGEEARTDSEFELEFFDLLRNADVSMPVAGALVDGWKVDAYWPEANLVVELDGYEFHKDRRAFERDRRKIAELRLAGREVLPLTYRQVSREPGWVLATVSALIRRGVAQLSRDAAA